MRVVGKAEALLGNQEEVAIQLLILVFVMQDDDPIFSRGNVIEARRGVIAFNREVLVAEGLADILRPADGRREEFCAKQAFRIAKTSDMNDEGAGSFACSR